METTLPDRVARRMVGRVPADRVLTCEVPRHTGALVEQLMALPDMASAVADAMDEEGIGAVFDGAAFTPVATGMRMCGPAVTLRYSRVNGDPSVNRTAGRGLVIGDRDLYGVAEAGDVAVFDCSGMRGWAVMGGLSAHWAAKAGVAGALVDGAVRDTATIIDAGVPAWSANRSPLAGRYRIEAVAINAQVSVQGVTVNPGDYVVADGDGVCIVPHEAFPRIVDACLKGQVAEDALIETVGKSTDLADLIRRTKSAVLPD